MQTADDFRRALDIIFTSAETEGRHSIDVRSGDLHRVVGGYPAVNHRMATCCSAMKTSMQPGDIIVEQPPSGKGANFVISYHLPR